METNGKHGRTAHTHTLFHNELLCAGEMPWNHLLSPNVLHTIDNNGYAHRELYLRFNYLIIGYSFIFDWAANAQT